MKAWTIGKRLVFGFGVVLVVSGMLGVYTVLRLSQIEKQAISIRDEAVIGLSIFSDVKGIAQAAANDVLRIALSDDPAEIAKLE